MLTIIITLVLSLGYLRFRKNDWYIERECFFYIDYVLAMLSLFGLVIGIFAGLSPISGYTEWQLTEEAELGAFSNVPALRETRTIYAVLSAENTYTYWYDTGSQFGTETSKTFKEQIVKEEYVDTVEDANCPKPVVRVYQRQGKKTIWTFAVLGKETRYILYVPAGTIYREVKTK